MFCPNAYINALLNVCKFKKCKSLVDILWPTFTGWYIVNYFTGWYIVTYFHRLIYCDLLSQFSPWKPSVHSHLKSAPSEWQRPAFLQGLGSHGSLSSASSCSVLLISHLTGNINMALTYILSCTTGMVSKYLATNVVIFSHENVSWQKVYILILLGKFTHHWLIKVEPDAQNPYLHSQCSPKK